MTKSPIRALAHAVHVSARAMSTRTVRASALDTLAIGLLVISLLIAWTGGVTFHFGGVRLAAHSVLRALIPAVGLLAIRVVLYRDLPAVPVLPRCDDMAAPGTRAHILGHTPRPPGLYVALGALTVTCCWVLRTQIANPRAVVDFGDPLFSAWRLGWIAHQLRADPRHLFDANIFFPERLSLTYSDPLLLPGCLAAPAIWAGLDPLIAANYLLVVAMILTALTVCVTAFRFGAAVPAAFVAGLCAAFYPYRFEHYSHLELQMFFWMPLAVLSLARLLLDPRVRRGVVFGAVLTCQSVSSMYYGVMLPLYLLPVAFVLIAMWRVPLRRPLLLSIVVAGLIGSMGAAILAPPFLEGTAVRGTRSPGATIEFSARPVDWLTPNTRNVLWGRWWATAEHRPERELFPGFTTPAFAILGAARLTPLSLALSAGAVSAFDWSLGFNGTTYPYIYRMLMPFRSLRSPVRFAVLVGTSLWLLAAFGASRILNAARNPAARSVTLVIIATASVVDLYPNLVLLSPPKAIPTIYSTVSPQMVLAEYPMDLGHNIWYMYFSTQHWARTVNGYSGYIPGSYVELETEVREFWRPDVLLALRRRGVTNITVNCALYDNPTACSTHIAELEGTEDVRLVASGKWQGGEVKLYELRFSH